MSKNTVDTTRKNNGHRTWKYRNCISENSIYVCNKKLAGNVAIGEETGSLDTMLISAADNFEYESEQAISRLISFLEPAMIIVMAVSE